MRHWIALILSIITSSAFCGEPKILMYSGPVSKMGGYVELLIGVSETNKSFGYITINGVKDTIEGGGEAYLEGKSGMYDEATGHVELQLSSGKWVHVYGFRSKQIKLEYRQGRQCTKFKLLKRQMEPSINGLYELKNDSISAKVYIYQLVGDDYINVHLYDNWDEHKYYGSVDSKEYGKYDVVLQPERKARLTVAKNQLEIRIDDYELILQKKDNDE